MRAEVVNYEMCGGSVVKRRALVAVKSSAPGREIFFAKKKLSEKCILKAS